jgi:hypothetical protein
VTVAHAADVTTLVFEQLVARQTRQLGRRYWRRGRLETLVRFDQSGSVFVRIPGHDGDHERHVERLSRLSDQVAASAGDVVR